MKKTIPLIIKSLVKKIGGTIILEPKYKFAGRINFPNGKFFYFKNTTLDINNFGAGEIAKDKGYTRFFMKKFGYPVARGRSFFSDYWCRVNNSNNNLSAAVDYARHLGYPLVVKPNSRSQGEGVFKIYNQEQLMRILNYLFKRNHIVLLEEFIKGDDYRLVVFKNKVMIAYRRNPLTVVGNGQDSIKNLFSDIKNKFFKKQKTFSVRLNDPRIKEKLSNSYKIDTTYIPKSGERVVLLDNANLSTGGVGEDVTDIIHQSHKEMAINLTKDLGLKFAGVDFITNHPIVSMLKNITFLEINSSPGLMHYMEIGKTAKNRVFDLYREVLLEAKRTK